MKKILIACIAVMAMFVVVGCLDVSSDGNGSGNDYSHDNDNRDQSIHDSNVSGSHGYGADEFDGEVSDDIPEDNDLTPIECKRANGFWCTLENRCLNANDSGGTCPNAR